MLLVTTSKALVTRSDALVPSSVLVPFVVRPGAPFVESDRSVRSDARNAPNVANLAPRKVFGGLMKESTVLHEVMKAKCCTPMIHHESSILISNQFVAVKMEKIMSQHELWTLDQIGQANVPLWQLPFRENSLVVSPSMFCVGTFNWHSYSEKDMHGEPS